MAATFCLYRMNNGSPEHLTDVPNVPTLSQDTAARYVASILRLGTVHTVADSTKIGRCVYFETDAKRRNTAADYRFILVWKPKPATQ